MLRTVLAIIAPWLLWGILDMAVYQVLLRVSPGSFDEQFLPSTNLMLILFLVLRATYSVDAGWIGAKISQAEQKPILLLAALLLLTGILVQAINWTGYPTWYHVGFLVPIIPCALLGARLGSKKRV